jgi:hypothetical protein
VPFLVGLAVAVVGPDTEACKAAINKEVDTILASGQLIDGDNPKVEQESRGRLR